MKMLRYPALALSTVLLTACGGGGDSAANTTTSAPTSSPTPVTPNQAQTTNMTGVVSVYNTVAGATVCLDQNNNLSCDTAEIQTTTNAQGQYTLANVTLNDSNNYPVIATIPANTPNTGMDVTYPVIPHPYTLTTPQGKHAVISPLTTVIREDMTRFASTAEQSADKIRYRLGFAKGVNLLEDYSKGADSAQKRLRHFGFGMAYIMADNLAKLAANALLPSYGSVFRLVAHNTLMEYQRVSDYVLDTGTQEAPIYYVQNDQLVRYTPVLDKLKALKLTEGQIYADEAFVFGINGYVPDDCAYNGLPANCEVPYKNSLIYLQSRQQAHELLFKRYSYSISTGNTVEVTPELDAHTLELKNNDWQLATSINTQFNAQREVIAFDLSNLPILDSLQSFGGIFNLYNAFNFATAKFPVGAKVFFTRVSASNTTRHLIFDSTVNNTTFEPVSPKYASIYPTAEPDNADFNNLDDFISFFSTHDLLISKNAISERGPGGIIAGYSSIENITARFGANGDLYLTRWLANTGKPIESYALPQGAWEIRHIENHDLLTLNLPANLASQQSKPFYAIYNGKVVSGASHTDSEDEQTFGMNAAAFNAFKAAIILDTSE